jgi:hypothetical protein
MEHYAANAGRAVSIFVPLKVVPWPMNLNLQIVTFAQFC